MEIRRMTKTDAPNLAALDKICFSIPWSMQSFLNETENDIAVYYVAADGDMLIGYCGYWRAADEGDITNVAVHPDYRRQGIGTRLISRLEEAAREQGLKSLTLEVRKSNTAAKELYNKFGFMPIGERKRYYSDNNEDAIIMAKNL